MYNSHLKLNVSYKHSVPPPPPSPNSLTHTHQHVYIVAVPNYLRTKLDLELEAKQNKLAEKAKEEEPVIKEKIKDFNELLSDSLDRIIEMRDILDDQRTRKGLSVDTI